MKICIHRGTQEIGGTCVEIAHDGSRIAIDLGLPLHAETNGPEWLPPVAGLTQPADDFLGIVISHPHQDHYGLLAHVHETVPIAMGQAARRILTAASRFVPGPTVQLGNLELRDRRLLSLGPFSITPFMVDHSAYDAYSLLIEAGGQRVFYSGDFRGHGRKAALFERLVAAPPTAIDCLMLEGTSIALATQAAGIIKGELGLPPQAFSYLTSHGSLDIEHIAFYEKLMNRLEEPADKAAVVHTAKVVYRLYGDMFRSLPLSA